MDEERPVPSLPYRGLPPSRGREDLYFPDRLWDLYVPIGLVLLGTLAGAGALVYVGTSPQAILPAIASYLIVKLLIQALAMPLLVAVAKVGFGTVPSAALKLVGLSIVPEAAFAWILIGLGPCLGLMVGLPTAYLASALLFGRLFDLTFAEARLCVVLNWGIGLVFLGIWWFVFDWLLGLTV